MPLNKKWEDREWSEFETTKINGFFYRTIAYSYYNYYQTVAKKNNQVVSCVAFKEQYVKTASTVWLDNVLYRANNTVRVDSISFKWKGIYT